MCDQQQSSLYWGLCLGVTCCSFTYCKHECQFPGCNTSFVTNDCVNKFQCQSCDTCGRWLSAQQIMELSLSSLCFTSPCLVTNSASFHSIVSWTCFSCLWMLPTDSFCVTRKCVLFVTYLTDQRSLYDSLILRCQKILKFCSWMWHSWSLPQWKFNLFPIAVFPIQWSADHCQFAA